MNIRDHERDMYIYHARKVDKRTFVDIGRELGITGNRVRQVYRRMDWQLNRFSSDHYLKHPEHVPDYAKPNIGKVIPFPAKEEYER